MKCINCFESVITGRPSDLPQIRNELWDTRTFALTFHVLLKETQFSFHSSLLFEIFMV